MFTRLLAALLKANKKYNEENKRISEENKKFNEENEENEDKNRSAYASFVFTISQKFSAEKVILKDIADEINSY